MQGMQVVTWSMVSENREQQDEEELDQHGEDVFILSGVTIGDGCCIGSRSVITKDLPPYTICVGQPCKPVKNRYNKEIIDFLLKLQWWNWDKEKIKINKKFFMTNLNTIKNVNELEKIIC